MIHINHSSLTLFGSEYELYGLIVIIGGVLIVLLNTLLAKHRRMDASLTFRITTLIIFGGVVFHIFFQNIIPHTILKWSYLISALLLPLLFRICGKLLKANENDFTEIGILSILEYSLVIKLSCTFAGCCYGPPWSGFPALIYGADTHNPLVGIPLFPLQPLMAIIILLLTALGIVAFFKNAPQMFLWSLLFLCITTYYITVFVSPASDGRETEAFCMIVLSLIISIILMIYRTAKNRKDAIQ